MGADIHMFTEVWDDPCWRFAGNMIENDWAIEDTDPKVRPEAIEVEQYYGLFAILAGVRNGVRLRENIRPIAEPRGLPADVSTEVSAWSEIDDLEFGHSWLTVAELLEFDWSQIAMCRGVVDNRVAYLFRDDPLGWPSAGWPVDITQSASNQGHGTEVTWRETYRDLAKSFYSETIPALRKLGPPEEVRVVFWFDE